MANGTTNAPSVEQRIEELRQREATFTDKLSDRRAIFEEMNKRSSQQFGQAATPLTQEQLDAGQAALNPLDTLRASQQFQQAGLNFLQPAIEDVEQSTQALNDLIQFNEQLVISNKQLALKEREVNVAEQTALLEAVVAAQEASGLGTAAQFNPHILGTSLQALDVKDLVAVTEKMAPLVDVYNNSAEMRQLLAGGKVRTGLFSLGAKGRATAGVGGLASKDERRYEALRTANNNNLLRLLSGAQVTPQEMERLQEQMMGWGGSVAQNIANGDRTLTEFTGRIGGYGVTPEQATAIVFAPLIDQPDQLQFTDQGLTAGGIVPGAQADAITGLDAQATQILDQFYPSGE